MAHELSLKDQIRMELLYIRRDDLGRELLKCKTMVAINAMSAINKAIAEVVVDIQNPPEVAPDA